MVNGIEGGRMIKKAKTWQLLWSDVIDEVVIMDIQQGCFSGVISK